MKGIEARIEHLIGEYNSDLTLRAWIALGVGLVSTAALFGFAFGFGWLVTGLFGYWKHASTAGLVFASGVVGLSFVSVMLKEDALAGLKPLSDVQLSLILVSIASPNFLYTSPRHAVAGFADLLVHGPRCLVEAVGLWFARLPGNGGMVRACSDNLARMEHGARAEEIVPQKAGVVMYRLGLIKVDRKEGAPAEASRFVRTGKGEDVVRGIAG